MAAGADAAGGGGAQSDPVNLTQWSQAATPAPRAGDGLAGVQPLGLAQPSSSQVSVSSARTQRWAGEWWVRSCQASVLVKQGIR